MKTVLNYQDKKQTVLKALKFTLTLLKKANKMNVSYFMYGNNNALSLSHTHTHTHTHTSSLI